MEDGKLPASEPAWTQAFEHVAIAAGLKVDGGLLVDAALEQHIAVCGRGGGRVCLRSDRAPPERAGISCGNRRSSDCALLSGAGLVKLGVAPRSRSFGARCRRASNGRGGRGGAIGRAWPLGR